MKDLILEKLKDIINSENIQYRDEDNFNIMGFRDSIAIFNIWNSGKICNIWLGKIEDDSGGLQVQIRSDDLAHFQSIVNLCKRFLQSGRRKVLRNFEKRYR